MTAAAGSGPSSTSNMETLVSPAPQSKPHAPLSGIRVLDFSRMLAGPICTALLADVGADVIKIESPEGGDDARQFEPKRGGESSYFMLANRGKRSVTLNLKSPEGLEIINKLVSSCDVVVENFKPGVTFRLGIDYAALRRINPKIVYASISGFGQTGPLSHRPAYDIIAQAMGGIMSINGNPGLPPTRVGESLGDIVSGIYASWGILVALQARATTGQGQHLDIAMLDSIYSLLITAHSQYLYTGKVPGRVGNAHPISAPLDSFRAKDGYLIIAVANDPMFTRLCQALGKLDLASDSRFATDANRKLNELALKAAIEEWTTLRTVAEAVAVLEAASVPASPILSVDQVAASEHAAYRELISHVNHATAGLIPLVRQPVVFLGTGVPPAAPPPLLGEHTRAVLHDVLNYDDAKIKELKRRAII